MERIDKIYRSSIAIISSVVFFVVGLILILFNDLLYYKALHILLLILLINGMYRIMLSILNKEKKSNLSYFVFNVVFALILFYFPTIPVSLFKLILFFYLILYFTIGVVKYFILKFKSSEKNSDLIKSSLYLILSYYVLILPSNKIDLLFILIGFYFIYTSFKLLFSLLMFSFSTGFKTKIKRRIRFRLPVLLECVVPYEIFKMVNSTLDNSEKQKLKNGYSDSTIEILIHLSNNGFNRVGHVDLCFNDKVYSYGNYDWKSRKFSELIGDGVMFIAPKDKYIPFCIKHSKKVIIGFEINLTSEEQKLIEKKLKDLISTGSRWNEPANSEKNNYTDLLYKETKAKFYKFNSGHFKTYFVAGVSCCDLVDDILSTSGNKILKINGIITPGTYYDFLNYDYINKNGLVKKRNIYTETS